MCMNEYLPELGEFLKARRAQLSPRTVDLPEFGAPRRAPGLRREEVAHLAKISSYSHARSEQGRAPVTGAVPAALVRVVHLDDDQRDHLFALAAIDERAPRRRPAQKVQPPLKRLLDELSATPALVPGRRMDIWAWNAMAAALLPTSNGFRTRSATTPGHSSLPPPPGSSTWTGGRSPGPASPNYAWRPSSDAPWSGQVRILASAGDRHSRRRRHARTDPAPSARFTSVTAAGRLAGGRSRGGPG